MRFLCERCLEILSIKIFKKLKSNIHKYLREAIQLLIN